MEEQGQVPLSLQERINMALEQERNKNASTFNMNVVIGQINSRDVVTLHKGAVGLRKILSTTEVPPTQALIDANIVPRIMEFLAQQVYQQLKAEAMWIITNMLSGSHQHAAYIVQKGLAGVLISSIGSEGAIQQNAVWAVGNLAGDCIKFRDMLLEMGALKQICGCILKSQRRKAYLGTLVWAALNLNYGRPLPRAKYCLQVVPALRVIFSNPDLDEPVLFDALNIVVAIINHKSVAQLLVEQGVGNQLLPILENASRGRVTSTILKLYCILFGTPGGPRSMKKFRLVSLFWEHFHSIDVSIFRWASVGLSLLAAHKCYSRQIYSSKLKMLKLQVTYKATESQAHRRIAQIYYRLVKSITRWGQPDEVMDFLADQMPIIWASIQSRDLDITKKGVKMLNQILDWQAKDGHRIYAHKCFLMRGNYIIQQVIDTYRGQQSLVSLCQKIVQRIVSSIN